MSREQHLDLDALADVLSGEASLGGQEHVAGCAACRADLDELRAAQARVTEELAALPPVTMPSDIAARLRNALGGATRVDADEPTTTAATTVTPFPTAEERANPARWLAAAAAVVVLLAGGLYGIAQLGGNDANTSSTAASGGGNAKAAPELAVARNNTGTDYTDRASLSAALPSLLSGGAADNAMVAAPAPAAGAPNRGAAPLAASVADPLAPLRDNKGLAECLLALLPADDPSVQPLAIDYASFKGQPAMVVVLPGSAEGKLDVFVVGPTCSRANDSVLFYTSVDKP